MFTAWARMLFLFGVDVTFIDIAKVSTSFLAHFFNSEKLEPILAT